MSAPHPIHLCIGAPRAGTTWLFREMSEHPALFVPQVKEVRYWNSRRNDLQRDGAVAIGARTIEGRHDFEDQKRWLNTWATQPQATPPSIQNYTDLMSVEGRASLDISPSYCFLPLKLIETLRADLPAGSKVLYLMRDPMDRLSSQIKLHYSLHGMYRGRPSRGDLTEFLDNPMQQKRWDYAGVLARWSTVFGDDFIPLSFENVVRDPKGLTLRVADALGFEMTTRARAPEDFSHSEKNQNTQIWVSSLGPSEKKQIAQAMLPAITTFAEEMPNVGATWLAKLDTIAQADPKRPDIIDDVDLPTQKLMRMTESLGDNCEYGFWQRHRGYEPSSLFRWAITPIDSLLAYFKAPRELFLRADLSAHSPGMVGDAAFGFKFHSKLVERRGDGALHMLEDSAKFDVIYTDEAAKIAHLAAKFTAQMRRQTGLYILKDNKGLTEDKARAVLSHLRAYNPNHHVLWVEPDGAPMLADLGNGLLRGSLPTFAPYAAADAYAENGWSKLMTLASRHENIAAQINTMQR